MNNSKDDDNLTFWGQAVTNVIWAQECLSHSLLPIKADIFVLHRICGYFIICTSAPSSPPMISFSSTRMLIYVYITRGKSVYIHGHKEWTSREIWLVAERTRIIGYQHKEKKRENDLCEISTLTENMKLILYRRYKLYFSYRTDAPIHSLF